MSEQKLNESADTLDTPDSSEAIEASETEARQVVGGAGIAVDPSFTLNSIERVNPQLDFQEQVRPIIRLEPTEPLIRLNVRPLPNRGIGNWDQGFGMAGGDGCISNPGGPSC